MRAFLFIFFLCFSVFASPLEAKTYSSDQIRRYVDKTPREKENNVSTLTAYLVKPFDTDYDKAKAIAFWIASRISYDEYLFNDGKTTRLFRTYDGQGAKELLKSRVGICSDFAELFATMCRRAGIRAHTVSGYVYPYGRSLTASERRNSGHAWNYFSYDGRKIYVDTTFMSKGRIQVKGSASATNRERSLDKVRKDNKNTSRTHNFDDFYFDFTYKAEKIKKDYVRKER